MEFRRLPIGTYTFSETQAPYGYLIDTTVRSFTIAADGSVTGDWYVANDRQQYRIQIVKEKESGVWNSETGQYDFPIVPAEGIIFSVYAAENIDDATGNLIWAQDTRVEEIQTDASGVATTTSDLFPGAYYAIETAATPDVVLDDQTRYPLSVVPTDQTTPIVTIEANNGEPIQNRAIAGAIGLVKVAGDTSLPLSGCTFNVFSAAGDLVDTITSGEDGLAHTKTLPYGVYTLIETQAYVGYALAEPQTVIISMQPEELDGFSDVSITIANQRLARVEIYKISENDQRPLSGVLFAIFDATTNTQVATMTTNEDGRAEATLHMGEYYMQEIETQDGYALSSERIPITAAWAAIYRFDLTNRKTEAILYKRDGTTLEGLSGAEYTVLDAEGTEVYIGTTGADGTLHVRGLLPGTYTFTETRAPHGYSLNADVNTFTIDRYGNVTGDTLIENDKTEVILFKQDALTQQFLPGAEFTVYNADGKEVWRGTTGADGTLHVVGIDPGVYTFQETAAPNGYTVINVVKTFTLDVYGKATGETLLQNEPTALVVHKTSTLSTVGLEGMQFEVNDAATGEPVEFEYVPEIRAYIPTYAIPVYNAGTSRVMAATLDEQGVRATSETSGTILITDADGLARIYYLTPGVYVVVETTAPQGFLMDSAPMSVSINEGTLLSNAAIAALENTPDDTPTGWSDALDEGLGIWAVLVLLMGAAILYRVSEWKERLEEQPIENQETKW
jgi:uncharacterized surface anchored protein